MAVDEIGIEGGIFAILLGEWVGIGRVGFTISDVFTIFAIFSSTSRKE